MSKLGPDHYRFVDEIGPEGVTIHCHRYIVVGETPCCYYVMPEGSAHYAAQRSNWSRGVVKQLRKRILKTSWKRYCYPELKDALRSYSSRKKWQAKHARLALSRAEAAQAEIENLHMLDLKLENFPHRCEGGEYIKGLSWAEY